MKRFVVNNMGFVARYNTNSGPSLMYYINVLSCKSSYGWQINKILF